MISFKHIKLFLFLLLIPFKMLADNSVGTPQASLDVNNNGAAIYNMTIEIPNGGGFHPEIGLTYNSQSTGYGHAGYGFNITGISVITSAGRDIYHDGEIKGATYLANSSFYLDGKKLLLESGTEGCDGATYTIEGNPYTKVTVHGSFSTSSVSTWFEVLTPDGVTYKYGSTASSRLTFSKDGKARCAAWYISSAVDKYKNTIEYNYMTVNKSVLPTSIIYGKNTAKPRGISCSINFTYSNIIYNNTNNNVRNFFIGGVKGNISKKLETITSTITSSGETKIYRKYTFGYDDNIDKCTKKYTRLTSITESNTNGDTYAPVKFTWNELQGVSLNTRDITIKTTSNEEVLSKSFLAVDMNNDAISDIVNVSTVKENFKNFKGQNDVRAKHVISVSLSENGSLCNNANKALTLALSPVYSDFSIIGMHTTDFNGDGYNDLVLELYKNKEHQYIFISIDDILKGSEYLCAAYDYTHYGNDKTFPLSMFIDVNGDGIEEIFRLSTINKGKNQNNIYTYEARITNYTGKIHRYNSFDQINGYFDLCFGNSSTNEEDSAPQKIFKGDYNCDGLQDLIIFYKKGYKIYYNNGSGSTVFSESNSKTGTDLTDCRIIRQGDFNGDGLIDFLCSKSDDGKLYLGYNNGNGTFYHQITSDFGLYAPSGTEKDNDGLSINVMDFDNDGMSDVVLAKSIYAPVITLGDIYTSIIWLKSTESNLVEIPNLSPVKKDRDKDASSQNIFVGDFDGDGALELAHYGSVSNSSSNSFTEHRIHIYKPNANAIYAGKLSTITDGLGVTNSITYSSAKDPNVYIKSAKKERYSLNENIPDIVNTYTIPIPLVSQISTGGKGLIFSTTKFQYGDLQIHSQGRGILGFSSITKNNLATGTSEVTTITKWDSQYRTPTEIVKTTTLSDKSQSTETIVTSIVEIGNAKSGKINKYYAYVSKGTLINFDKYTTITTNTYDYNAERCILKNQTISDDGGKLFKSVDYEYDNTRVGKYGNMWLPKTVISNQKHSDDKALCTVYTTYEYDDWGNPTKIVNNAHAVSNSLSLYYTYDPYYGNKLSEKSIGRDVKTIIKYFDYDTSGRFITGERTSPECSSFVYKYNIFGDLLEEKNNTVSTLPLVTSHLYNAWNEETYRILPDDKNRITYTRVWDTSIGDGCYSITETPVIGPSKKIVYDALGREVYSVSTGMGGIPISKSITYSSDGYISSIVNKTGDLTITETTSYDCRGRLTSDKLSSGKTTTYNYSGRKVTSTTAGKATTTEYDAWGNVKSIIDPADNYVEYKYFSNGQPSSITTYTNSGNNSTVTFKYDQAGRRTYMNDPDAGEMEYYYAADGTILSQIDARGVRTYFDYDELGRIIKKSYSDTSGKTYSQINIYGTSGANKNRIIEQRCNGNKRTFTYDCYGRIVTERRYVNHGTGQQCYAIRYGYNEYGQKISVTYPGNIVFNYIYHDKDGYLTEIKLNNSKTVYKLNSYNGLTLTTNTVAGILSKKIDSDGYPSEYKLEKNSSILDSQNYTFEKTTGNLLTRTWLHNGKTVVNEKFRYDKLDRLSIVFNNKTNQQIMSMAYADNGNILKKSNVGEYTYDSQNKPHAVTSVSNTIKLINSNTVSTEFHLNGKINVISDDYNGASIHYVYGPNDEKWMSTLCDPNQLTKNDIEHVYFGDYEKIIKDDTISEYYFIENGVIVIKKTVGKATPTTKAYQSVTDYLGSILAVYDENNNEVFKAKYDAWGKQTITTNQIDLCYGYTGHEMLPQFGLINMVGRLYDPALGRFLSCDNYVQEPTNSQNFNRYSYCLNNPLKYTDPDGQVAWIVVGAIVGAVGNIAYQTIEGNINNVTDFFVAGFIGAGAGALSAVTGGAAGSLIGSNVGVLAGAASGALSGAVGGLVGSLANNALNAAFLGAPFSWKSCLMSGLIGGVTGGIIGGVTGGISAYKQGLDVLTGKAKMVSALPSPTEPIEGVSVVSKEELALESKVTIKDTPVDSRPTLKGLNNNSSPHFHVKDNRILYSPKEWQGLSSSYERGQVGIKLAMEDLQAEFGKVKMVTDISVKVNGVTYRPDLSFIDKNGVVHMVEVKTGIHPQLTPNQKIAIPALLEGNTNVAPFGGNAATLFKGNIPTKIDEYVFDIYWYRLLK